MSHKCYCATHLYSPVEFPPIWIELKEKGQLCDGLVHCDDGSEFKVHRAILAAVSPYFKALFTNSINRNQPETQTACVNAPGNIFNKLLEYAYGGVCKIDHDNFDLLMRYADQYEILGVMQLCCQFILGLFAFLAYHLEPKNCLGLARFARQYFCKELESRSRRYILMHFMEVLRQSNELVLLSFNELVEILGDDELNIKTEEVAFETVKQWIDYDFKNRRKHLLPLLNTVRSGNLRIEYLQCILDWPPVFDNRDCKSLIDSAIETAEGPRRNMDIVSNPLLRPRVPQEILFAIGGWTAGSPTNFIETYDTRADKWLLNGNSDSIPRAYHGVCSLNGMIYLIGGFDGNEHFSSVRCFNPVDHKWKNCACMYQPRCYVSVATHGGKIYAIGGFNGRIRMSSVERYDPMANQWELVQPMQRQRSDACATTLNDKIYIVGGFNGTDVLNSAEVYDTTTNQWTYIPPMMSARSGVSLIGHRGTLYALGGFNGFTRLMSAESYSPGNSSGWDSIADMCYPRSNFATIVLDGHIFAIGGFNVLYLDRFVIGSSTINHVECYDAEVNEWLQSAPMNLHRSALSACVISGLPNAKEYSIHGKDSSNMQIQQRDSEN